MVYFLSGAPISQRRAQEYCRQRPFFSARGCPTPARLASRLRARQEPQALSPGVGRASPNKRKARCDTFTAGLADYCRQRPTLPHSFPCSTIGGSRLNFRVRNGNGCDPAPMTTGISGEKSALHIGDCTWQIGFLDVKERNAAGTYGRAARQPDSVLRRGSPKPWDRSPKAKAAEHPANGECDRPPTQPCHVHLKRRTTRSIKVMVKPHG